MAFYPMCTRQGWLNMHLAMAPRGPVSLPGTCNISCQPSAGRPFAIIADYFSPAPLPSCCVLKTANWVLTSKVKKTGVQKRDGSLRWKGSRLAAFMSPWWVTEKLESFGEKWNLHNFHHFTKCPFVADHPRHAWHSILLCSRTTNSENHLRLSLQAIMFKSGPWATERQDRDDAETGTGTKTKAGALKTKTKAGTL